ncbi:MAG TPA: pilus assembly protein TadG-related protein, partial [Terriglobales bacterium]|nr:pilus assembly protein TadG-related protein [Terriglobales bacterium]
MKCHRKNGQRGVTLVMVALFIVVLVGMVALAVDLGVLFTARTSAQHAADAAALAGAFTLQNPGALQDMAAKNAAVAVAAKNKILGQPVTITPADVNVDVNARQVTVTVHRTVGTFFAPALAVFGGSGFSSAGITVRATAEASSRAAGDYCFKPFWIPNTVLSKKDRDDACFGPGEKEILFDAQGNITDYAAYRLSTAIQLWTKVGNPASQWDVVDIDQHIPGVSISQAIGDCLNVNAPNAVVQCGDVLQTANGVKVGQVGDDVDNLIGTPNQDTWGGLGQYRDGTTGDIKDSSRSLVTVAVWDDCKD